MTYWSIRKIKYGIRVFHIHNDILVYPHKNEYCCLCKELVPDVTKLQAQIIGIPLISLFDDYQLFDEKKEELYNPLEIGYTVPQEIKDLVKKYKK